MKNEFEKNGYYVLRNVLTNTEVGRLAGPIRAAFNSGDYDTYQEGSAYPSPGIHSMGPRVLEEYPDLAELSLAHPAIVAAVQELFGEPATLAQYWSIMRPPGAGVGDKPFIKGSGAHYDYKPWRCVGSYVKWMFAVIPFVDYTETAGPLAISPGSHLKTAVRPSDGRVHQVDAAQVPSPAEIRLVDPSLKKGDVVLMDGFLWHEARPNHGNSDRCGLYMKFHARSSPPACGPTIYPSAVHDFLPDDVKHLLPYHRGDGQYAALRDGPVGGVDEARLLIEDSDENVLVLGNDTDGWQLPKFAAAEDASAGILDVCNVMGSVVTQSRDQLGLQLPWLSWLADLPGQAPNHTPDGVTGEWRCRVYGHRLPTAGPELNPANGLTCEHRWMSAEELEEVNSAALLECGAGVLKWLHMWQTEEDEDGRPITRSYGLPTTDVEYYSYNRNGNPKGTYRIGEFDESGRPAPARE
ncbi:MAG: phytanoyl-CoA dioxygenase family protein [Alphaproteobacteria bacterium]|nr:phytanoyl-CoA dioxygenase family protein [Alphaproteobacteria bacterium]